MRVRDRDRKVKVELLEPRTLLSSSFPNVNISKMLGNQAEGAITVDRADPSKLFAVSNIDVGDGLMAATSSNGGSTWSQKTIANDKDGLPAACCDPSTEFDSFGNLFLTYLNSATDSIIVLRSTDEGQSFKLLTEFHGNVDQPTINAGPGSVWVEWDSSNGIAVSGASDTGLGATGSFSAAQTLPGSGGGAFGDIAVGPSGQVMATYEKDSGSIAKIYVNVDPDGLGPAHFGKPIVVTNTHVQDFDFIPAQFNRGIDAEAGLAFDRSGGAFNGRVYLVYTDQTPGTANTDIFLRYSDNNGAAWSNPIRVNDDTTLNSQLLPRIALDNTTGDIAIGWYDARNDLGAGGPGDTDHQINDDVQYWGTIVTPTTDGLLVAPNQQISAGTSNADDANSGIDLGDYTGLDFYNGTMHPEWFDNSNSTADNPDGTLKDLDVYTASVHASAFNTTTTTISLGGRSDPSGLVASLPTTASANAGFIKHGRTYIITVQYSDTAGINLASLAGSNLLITGPGGYSDTPQLLHAKAKAATQVLATYRLINPKGNFTSAQAGTYTILLQPDQVLDSQRRATTGGILGTFAVATAATSSHSGGTGQRHHHEQE